MNLRKQALIKTLENELLAVPQYSLFGDDNHTQINTAISFLKGNISEDDILNKFEDNTEVVNFIDSVKEYLSGDVKLADIIWNKESIVKQIDLVPTIPPSKPNPEIAFWDTCVNRVKTPAKSIADCFEPMYPREFDIKVCKKLCGSCPFSNTSLKGFLADYTIQGFANYQNNDISFPCHKVMTNEDKSVEEVQDMFNKGELYLCRGYVESIIKSCIIPKKNQFLKDAIEQVKKEGLSDKSMSINEFKKYHRK